MASVQHPPLGAGGKLVAVKRVEGCEDIVYEDGIHRNILYEPLSPAVLKQAHKAHIHVCVVVGRTVAQFLRRCYPMS